MHHRLVISNRMWTDLREHLLSDQKEHLAFILAGFTSSGHNCLLFAREVITVPKEAFKNSDTAFWLDLQLDFLLDVFNKVNKKGLALIEAHSHPLARDNVHFSRTDDEGQEELVNYLSDTLPNRPYAALVLGQSSIDGRIWLPRIKSPFPLNEVRVIGEKLSRFSTTESLRTQKKNRLKEEISEHFHRQVLAIGETGQRIVQELRVGVVGLGGIGSMVIQQLTHLGVQSFVLVDDDRVESSNLHRLAGSIPDDVGQLKVDVARRNILAINSIAKIQSLAMNVRNEGAIQKLKEVDVLFGCVDTDAGRMILNEIALAYLLPYIDCGVGIRASEQGLEEIGGKVNVWTPGRPCLLCCKDFSPSIAAEELESEEQLEFRRKHGYVEGAQVPEPAVMTLNGTIASIAAGEFLAMVASVRPSIHYTFSDYLEGRTGRRIVKHNSKCTACVLYGLGDKAKLDRYSLPALPSDIPRIDQ